MPAVEAVGYRVVHPGAKLHGHPRIRARGIRRISASESKTAVFVVPAQEDLMIAMHVDQMARSTKESGDLGLQASAPAEESPGYFFSASHHNGDAHHFTQPGARRGQN